MVVGPFRGGSLGGGYTMWWLGLSVVGHCVVVGSFCGGSLCGGCTVWWLGLSVVGLSVVGHCVVGHCVVGHCVVGAQCGGYAMVVNVPNPAPIFSD